MAWAMVREHSRAKQAQDHHSPEDIRSSKEPTSRARLPPQSVCTVGGVLPVPHSLQDSFLRNSSLLSEKQRWEEPVPPLVEERNGVGVGVGVRELI